MPALDLSGLNLEVFFPQPIFRKINTILNFIFNFKILAIPHNYIQFANLMFSPTSCCPDVEGHFLDPHIEYISQLWGIEVNSLLIRRRGQAHIDTGTPPISALKMFKV